MSYPAYPEYKPTRCDWLGDLPSHWEVNRLKWSVKGCVNGLWGDEPSGLNDIACIRVADFNRENFTVSSNGLTFRSIDHNQLATRLLQKGDLLIEKSGGGEKQLVGCVVYFDHEFDAISSNFIARMPVEETQNARFWCYQHASLYAAKVNFLAIKQTTGIQNLDSSYYLSSLASYPPIAEQKQIADFLDWKTGQIDALIEKKKQLIEKLQEQRIAVITQAVTKGLNPDVPMKDSGIPWLGQVPEHWEVGGFTKFVEHKADYRGKTPEKVPEGVFLVTAKNIKTGRIDYDVSQEFVLEDDYASIMSRGLPEISDLLFTTEAPLGEVANVDRVDIALAQRVIKFRGEPQKLNNYFAKYWMMGAPFQGHLASLATGSTALGIKASKLFALRCLIPPLQEQQEIVDFLDLSLEEFSNLRSRIVEAITRLTEYRTALITAATTGKIDVRNVTIPTHSAEQLNLAFADEEEDRA